MPTRIRPATFSLLVLTLGCEAKWTDVRAPYSRFEIREVVDLAQPFASYVRAGSDRPVAEGACEGVEFQTEQVPPRSGRNVVYAWAATRSVVEKCASSVSTPAAEVATEKAASGFRTYNLGPVRVLSGADVVRGRLEGKDDMLLLQLEITPVATRRMFEFTKSRIGQRMAIVIDGHVESAPLIMGPINSSRLSLSVTDRTAGLALLRRLTGTQH